jgi:hypothetical protein
MHAPERRGGDPDRRSLRRGAAAGARGGDARVGGDARWGCLGLNSPGSAHCA